MDEYWIGFSLNATKGVEDHEWMYIVHEWDHEWMYIVYEWERNNQEMNYE